MSDFRQMQTFVDVVNLGSLSAAARAEGVVPAVIGRRIDALEERLGVRLLVRTTRRVTLTQEGGAFHEDCQRLLGELATAGFGRRHVAPHVATFQQANPDVRVTIDLSDRLVDLVAERVDVAIRISDLADSSLVAVRLAENRRVVVASPAYLSRRGIPASPADLDQFDCLTLGSSRARGWTFMIDGRLVNWRVQGRLECNDGAVLHDWALKGYGLAWRSLWEVKDDLPDGRLMTVLDAYSSPDYPVCAVVQQRKFLPQRVRAFVDHLRAVYADPDYWD